jgi:hypothetical protein
MQVGVLGDLAVCAPRLIWPPARVVRAGQLTPAARVCHRPTFNEHPVTPCPELTITRKVSSVLFWYRRQPQQQ